MAQQTSQATHYLGQLSLHRVGNDCRSLVLKREAQTFLDHTLSTWVPEFLSCSILYVCLEYSLRDLGTSGASNPRPGSSFCVWGKHDDLQAPGEHPNILELHSFAILILYKGYQPTSQPSEARAHC